MNKAVVTGGGGFIGLAIVKRLVEMGVETSIIGRNPYPAADKLGVRCLCGDIRDKGFLLRATSGYDTVFHVAAKTGIWGSFQSYYSTNYLGTKNIVECCRQNNIKILVYTSTPSVVFNGLDIHNGEENLPYATNPLCHYAATKILAEKYVLQANDTDLKTTALRPHLVWGPGDTNLIPRLLARGRAKDLKIVGKGKNRVDISYIDNVALAHILAAQNLEREKTAAGEPFFISQGEAVVLWDWINGLFERLDMPLVEDNISYSSAYAVGWLFEHVYKLLLIKSEPKMTRFLAEQLSKSHYFSIKKARNILNYSPAISTEEGVDRLIGWLERKNSYLLS